MKTKTINLELNFYLTLIFIIGLLVGLLLLGVMVILSLSSEGVEDVASNLRVEEMNLEIGFNETYIMDRVEEISEVNSGYGVKNAKKIS